MKNRRTVICLIGQLGNGGSEKQLYLFLKYLDNSKYSPIVVVSSISGGSRWERQIREEISVPVIFLGNIPKIMKFAKFAWLIMKKRPSIVFSWSFYTNAFCMVCPGIRFIGSLRGDLFIAKSQIGHINYQCSLKPRHFVVNSRFLAKELMLERIPKDNISVVYNIFAQENNSCGNLDMAERRSMLREKLGIPRDAVVVAGIGRSSPEKDFPFFISVLEKAGVTEKKIFGLLIGEMGEDIRNKIREMNLQDKFILTGKLESAHEILPAADIFFLSSISEGMPNALIEAVDAGCAILATDVGGVWEILEPLGTDITYRIIISDREASSAAAKLLFLSQNPCFMEKIREHRIKMLEKFSPDKICLNIMRY
jgi:glycosyltransferase involved in cell wall biosynthesis